MTRQLTFCLVGDGGTDRALVSIIQWAIHRLDPGVDILDPDFRKRQGSVEDFLASFDTEAMMVFVHRDAENESVEARLSEFGETLNRVVPVIPVRMTEAWLLVDAHAVAAAADAPDARVRLPPVRQLESIADPKERLHELLLEAAGDPTGRRRKKFRASLDSRRLDVARRVADYSRLEGVPSFKRFQDELKRKYPYSS